MTKEQIKLIEKAKPYEEGILFYTIYIINSNKRYNGFWGKNDYKNIIVLGETTEHELYLLNDGDCDILEIENQYNYNIRFEIPVKENCLHMWVDEPYKIKATLRQSNINLKIVRKL